MALGETLTFKVDGEGSWWNIFNQEKNNTQGVRFTN